ncbi:MAG TPA: SRPBCC domain-containing protein [Candidatus Acidoferrum sp.]|nr:SRPBCC domain-containing protein [Candidatus Acidoferrum sp.]
MSETKATPAEPVKKALRREIEIAAPVEEVWKALTDPQELTKWFPLEARITPGVGGSLFLSWGPAWEGETQIVGWEPGKRFACQDKLALIEWTLEARGGKTILRLVQSGFSSGAAWEDEWFDSTTFGWGFMLVSLRHALERHRGQTRLVAWPKVKTTLSREEAYRKLAAAGALFTQGFGDPGGEYRDGAEYALTTETGENISGEVEFVRPPRGFCLRVSQWNDALLWASIEGTSGELEVQLWLSAFGLTPAVVGSWENRWRQKLEQIFSGSVFR